MLDSHVFGSRIEALLLGARSGELPSLEFTMRSNLRYRLGQLVRISVPWLLLFVFMNAGGSRASGCSCTPEASAPACQLIARAQIVFLGESFELIPDPRDAGSRLYRFRVDRVYKGLHPSTKEVLVNSGFGTSCQNEYSTGTNYLMFASGSSENPLIVFAGMCSGSRRAEYAQSDVEFLEDYVNGKTTTAVYGKVLQWV